MPSDDRLYRFAGFTASPARRQLLHGDSEVPLISRYLDLLLLLLQHRQRVVGRREILDAVWGDVAVSDGALSQAVRTLRRALGDGSKTPRFIGTVSGHGYRFILEPVTEELEGEAALPPLAGSGPPVTGSAAGGGIPDAAPAAGLDCHVLRLVEGDSEAVRRDAAETLHGLGTERARHRLAERGAPAAAWALLRDTRWDVAGAGPVPLLGHPGGFGSLLALGRLRLRRAARQASRRWGAAAVGGGLAGMVAGLLEGLVLLGVQPESIPSTLPWAYATIGAIIGAVGATGVGAGLAAAEALARSARGFFLVFCGAAGGGAVGLVAHVLGRMALEGVFGRDLSTVGGGLEGLMLGGAAGLGYALSTRGLAGGGMAAPRGRARLQAALVTGLSCGLAAVALTGMGGSLGGTSLEILSRSFPGSQVGLLPVAHLLGEQTPGTLTLMVQSAYEGLLFGAGLTLGITSRVRDPG